MSTSRCQARTSSGEPCRAYPVRDHAYCFAHSPAHKEAAQQARRRGGFNRRRRSPVAEHRDIENPATVDGLRQLFEIAVSDTLTQENSLQRNQLLVSTLRAGIQVASFIDVNERLASLERALMPRDEDGGT